MRASLPIKAMAFCGVALMIGVACRVFIPYYQQQQDDPVKSESREQVSAIMKAVNQFVEQHPEHQFPTNVSEVTPFIALASTNVDSVYSRFVYLPPPLHASTKELFGRVVLIEKLGHYKYKVGGYHGMAGDAIPGWYSIADYKALVEKNGVSLEQLSERQN
jgi:hypothetical protein